MRIAWIGLGAMGWPMAIAAARAGHVVTRVDRHSARRADAAEATRPPSMVRETVSQADLVAVTLATEAQVREVMLDGGALGAMPADAILVLHTTVSPGFAQELARRRGDISVLDAGMVGGPEAAAKVGLTLLIGGDLQVLETARPVLETYAERLSHVGPLGSGMTLKAIHSLTFAAHISLAREALGLAEAKGVDIVAAVEALGRSEAGCAALNLIAAGAASTPTNPRRGDILKDVAAARQATQNHKLGLLDVATREFSL